MHPVERRVIQVLFVVGVPLLLYPIRGLFTWERLQVGLAVAAFLVAGSAAVVLALVLIQRIRTWLTGREKR